MLITSTLVHTDIHNKAIPPMPFVYPHVVHLPDPRILINRIFRSNMATDTTYADGEVWDEKTARYEPLKKNTLRYYFFMLVRFIFEGNEKNMLAARVGAKNWFGRLLWTAAQGAALGIVCGFPLWCLAVTILGPIYGTRNMGNKWAPQVIKFVYAAIVGWVTNPIIAILALGSQSEHHLVAVGVDPEAGTAGAGGDQAEIHTIREEDEHDYVAAQAATNGSSGPPSTTPPFHEPFRSNTTGHSPLGGQDTQGSSPRRSPLLTPSRAPDGRPARSRAGSVSVSRPPLTANASSISQLDSTPRTAPQRPRGLTTSSFVSTTSGSNFAYALGGTGGRAQRRPRSNTATSARSLQDLGSARPGSSGLPSPSPNFLNLPGAFPRSSPKSSPNSRDRTLSTQSDAGLPPRLELPKELDVERREGEYDVFGRNDVPELTLQRPSVEVARETEVVQVRTESELGSVSESGVPEGVGKTRE